MLETLKHRGPDGDGVFVERGLGLGMRRLAIMDVAHGTQPYVSEDGRLIAVFNGEIYNFPELSHMLVSRGHQLRSKADGEVLVHLYEEYGPDFLSHLTGMFALAIWDRTEQELLLARDRVGQKPLYLLEQHHTLAFSSEIKAFWGIEGYSPEVDETAIASYLGHRFMPAPQTMVQGVTKLRPGEAMTVRRDGHRRRWLYWEPLIHEPDSQGSLNQWAERLDDILSRVVPAHLASDVPVGIFLSGGLDSSLLAALAAQHHQGPLHAWSAAFPAQYPGYDEFSWAKRVADLNGLSIRRVDVDPIISADRMRELAYILDEPMADPTVLPLDGVAQAAKDECTVMLSGEGADEIFGGYKGYGEVQSLEWVRRIPQGLRSWWIRQGFKGSGAFKRSLEPIRERYRGVGYTFSPEEQHALLVGDLSYSDRPIALLEYWEKTRNISELQAMQGFDVRWFLPDDVLLKADRVGMHHNLEIRVPYCDHEVVELALNIPLALRRNRALDKRVLRKASERHIPRDVVYRPKSGFPTPLTALLAGPLYDAVYDLLTDRQFVQRGWFQQHSVEQLLSQLATKNPGAARKVYSLFMLELWVQELVEGQHKHLDKPMAPTNEMTQNPPV